MDLYGSINGMMEAQKQQQIIELFFCLNVVSAVNVLKWLEYGPKCNNLDKENKRVGQVFPGSEDCLVIVSVANDNVVL